MSSPNASECIVEFTRPIPPCGSEQDILTIKLVSLSFGLIHLLLLYVILESFTKKLMSMKKLSLKDTSMKWGMQLVSMCVLGLVQWMNLNSIFYADLGISLIAEDIASSLGVLMGWDWAFITHTGLSSVDSGITNKSKKWKRGSLMSLSTVVVGAKVVTFGSSIISRVMFLSSTDLETKQLTGALSALVPGVSLTMLSLLSSFSVRKIHRMMLRATKNTSSTSKVREWRKLQLQLVVLSAMSLAAGIYLLLISSSRFTTVTSVFYKEDISKYSTFGKYFLDCIKVCFLALSASNLLRVGRGEIPGKQVSSSSGIRLMQRNLLVGILSVLTMWLPFVLERYFIVLTTVGTCICVLLWSVANIGHVYKQSEMMRQEEVLAASMNYVSGKTTRWYNIIPPVLEFISLTFVAFDSLFLYWAPEKLRNFLVSCSSIVTLVGDSNFIFDINNSSKTAVTILVLVLIQGLAIAFILSGVTVLPKAFLKVMHILAAFLYDIGIMQLVSFFFRRLQCESLIFTQGIHDPYSLYGGGRSLMYSNLICDGGYYHIITVIYTCLVIAFPLVGFSVYYALHISNKARDPRLRSLPFFNGFKVILKVAIVAVACLTPTDPLSWLAPFTPWNRAFTNTVCIGAILYFSVTTLPYVGPQSNGFNVSRSIAYGIAFGANAASLISLVAYETLPISVSYVIPPILLIIIPAIVTAVTYRAVNKSIKSTEKRGHWNLKQICNHLLNPLTTVNDIETIMAIGQNDTKDPSTHLAVLALVEQQTSGCVSRISQMQAALINTNPATVKVEVKVGIHRTNTNLNGMKYTNDRASVVDQSTVFNILLTAVLYREGTKKVMESFGESICQCILSAEAQLRSLVESLPLTTTGSIDGNHRDVTIIEKSFQCCQDLLSLVITPSIKLLFAMCTQSKYYKMKLQGKYGLKAVSFVNISNYAFLIQSAYFVSVGSIEQSLNPYPSGVMKELFDFIKIIWGALVFTSDNRSEDRARMITSSTFSASNLRLGSGRILSFNILSKFRPLFRSNKVRNEIEAENDAAEEEYRRSADLTPGVVPLIVLTGSDARLSTLVYRASCRSLPDQGKRSSEDNNHDSEKKSFNPPSGKLTKRTITEENEMEKIGERPHAASSPSSVARKLSSSKTDAKISEKLFYLIPPPLIHYITRLSPVLLVMNLDVHLESLELFDMLYQWYYPSGSISDDSNDNKLPVTIVIAIEMDLRLKVSGKAQQLQAEWTIYKQKLEVDRKPCFKGSTFKVIEFRKTFFSTVKPSSDDKSSLRHPSDILDDNSVSILQDYFKVVDREIHAVLHDEVIRNQMFQIFGLDKFSHFNLNNKSRTLSK